MIRRTRLEQWRGSLISLRSRNGFPMCTAPMVSHTLNLRITERTLSRRLASWHRSSDGFPTRSSPFSRNAMTRNFRCTFRHFGVLSALTNGVSLVGMKTASKGRRGSSGSCYNRRRINDLRSRAAGAKIGQYFYWHSQGNKVKSFIPVSE